MSEKDPDQAIVELYDKIYQFAGENFGEYDPLAVAAVMMATALRIYKTGLPDDDFDKMVQHVYDNRHKVLPFDTPKLQ
jgi:hypothetical protein